MAYFDCIVGGSGDGSTLTVTCYSGFAGLTISITNGVDTFSEVCPSTSPYDVIFEGLANGTWTLSTVYNGVTYTETVEVNLTSQFYPIPEGATATPTDDIQTWLLCASIFDKNYTSIAQVLADASTLQALIASNNAVDYMVRSTTWASSVTADSNAMTYIGANNYCADALLDNTAWCTAICNSTYFESVLNVKVPTMTSNTTPSGACGGDNHYGSNDYYYAFDNNIGSGSWCGPSGTSGAWKIWYCFPNNVKVKFAKFYTDTSARFGQTQIVGGNSASNLNSIKTLPSVVDGWNSIVLDNNNNAMPYYGIYVNLLNRVTFFAIQFYGRAS